MSKAKAYELAREIARDLFTNGNDDHAVRLVFDNALNVGWSEDAVALLIFDRLVRVAVTKKKSEVARPTKELRCDLCNMLYQHGKAVEGGRCSHRGECGVIRLVEKKRAKR